MDSFTDVSVQVRAGHFIDYAKELNPQQLQAVTCLDGHYLVIAGAGSGKTRTLVYRVAYLIEQGIDPRSILLLTYTRKAAQEMMSRAVVVFDERCQNIVGGTFHAYAYRVLREYARHVGYASAFTVMDSVDAESLIKMVLNEPEFSEQKKQLPRAAMIAGLISKSLNTGLPLDRVIGRVAPQFQNMTEVIVEIEKKYRRQKIQKSLMDFDDLLLYLKKLLQECDSVGQQIAKAHQYIMVDEYQDTNQLQAEIVALLAKGHDNLMAVGDDSQSIYSFRGANFKNIMTFPKMFSDCRIITLEQNYRSTQPILTFSNAVLNSVREKYSKRLFSDIASEQKPLYIRPKNEQEEAEIICQAIQQLHGEGLPLGEIAVLFRAAAHSHHLEIELTKHEIPFIKYGGIRFAESAHVKDLLALLKIILNPLDAIAWCRILALLDGLGSIGISKIVYEVVDNQKGYDCLLDDKFAGKKYSPTLATLRQTIQEFQAASSIPEKIGTLLKFYTSHLESNYEDSKNRMKDLETLTLMASGYKNIDKFLAEIIMEPPDIESTGDNQKKVVLSTIHSAKGLEWHTVFVIHLLEGLFPSCYALDDSDKLEEERRLFYVAVTRAKKNLCLLTPSELLQEWVECGVKKFF
jgi:DNA helicase-2/ATP-dependent DNA helicase PcrA